MGSEIQHEGSSTEMLLFSCWLPILTYRREAEFEAASELTFRPDNALTAGRFPEVRKGLARAECLMSIALGYESHDLLP